MTLAAGLLVLLGGAAGAVLRHLTNLALPPRGTSGIPWATFVVNIAGSALLGATAGSVSAADGPEWVLTLLGTGFCGALTTYSTFSYQTVLLGEAAGLLAALRNVVAHLVLGLGACAGGWSLGIAAFG